MYFSLLNNAIRCVLLCNACIFLLALSHRILLSKGAFKYVQVIKDKNIILYPFFFSLLAGDHRPLVEGRLRRPKWRPRVASAHERWSHAASICRSWSFGVECSRRKTAAGVAAAERSIRRRRPTRDEPKLFLPWLSRLDWRPKGGRWSPWLSQRWPQTLALLNCSHWPERCLKFPIQKITK